MLATITWIQVVLAVATAIYVAFGISLWHRQYTQQIARRSGLPTTARSLKLIQASNRPSDILGFRQSEKLSAASNYHLPAGAVTPRSHTFKLAAGETAL